MKNYFYLISLVYLNPSQVDIELDLAETLESYVRQFKDLTVKLQDYTWSEEFLEGCLSFTLSRKLTKEEKQIFIDEWDTENVSVQFHKKLRIL